MFSGVGKTPEEAKADMLFQMKFLKESAIEKSFSYPAFLDEEFEVVYKFDTESLLQYYAGVITPAALERLSGIHQKQLWNYLNGRSKPRKQQVEKIEKALHSLGAELTYCYSETLVGLIVTPLIQPYLNQPEHYNAFPLRNEQFLMHYKESFRKEG